MNAELKTSVTPAQLDNIEVINVTASAAVTLGLDNAGQVTNVNNTFSTADLTVSGIAANAALSVQDVDSKNTTFTYASTSGTSDTAGLTVSNVVGGAAANISIAGVETVNITSNGTTANNFKLTDSAATTVNVSGANNLTLALGTLTAPTAINASNMTGNFTAVMAGTGTLTGGSGADNLGGAAGVKATIIGGAGTDTITAGGGATHADSLAGGLGNDLIVNADLVANTATAANNDSIDGGEGFDTLSSTSAAFAAVDNTATGAIQSISNIEAITVSDPGGLADSLTLSKIQAGIQTVNLSSGVTGARTVTFDSAVANAAINLGGRIDTAANFGVTAAGTATNDALTINNAATSGPIDVFNGGQIVATGYETLTLNGGTSDKSGQSLDILTVNTSNGNAATVKLTGDNAFTLSQVNTNNTGVLTIDASGLTKTTGTVFSYYDNTFATGSTQSITGSAGNDVIEANNGKSATIVAGAGNDTLTGGTAADSILGGTGNDNITGGGGNDVLKGEAGEDTITGGTGADSIDGGADNDSLVGAGGNDTINGGDGVDTIVATVAGNVSIDAGAGNDRVEVGDTLNASDVVSGGEGTLDVLSTTTATIGNIATVTNFEVLELGTTVAAQDMSKYTGNSGFTRVDELRASGAAITSAGAALQEFRMAGGTNSFALATNTSADSLTLGAATNNNTTVVKVTANDIETITVGAGAIASTVKDFAITGVGAGEGLVATKMTTLNIGAGINADVLVVDQGDTDGAEVLTTVNATAATGTVKVDLSQFDVASVTMNGAATKENTLIGGAGNDSITGGTVIDSLVGNAGNDTIVGNGGDDYLSGGAGNDSLTGGTGNDSISGGDGNDTINSGSAGNDTIDGGNGANSVTTGSGDDSITTGTGADTITSGAGADTITSGDGNDVITSGAGANVITAGAGADAVTLTAGTDVDTVFQSASESIAATANGLSATIAIGDTLTFGNGVDNVQNFTAGTGGDVLAIGTVLKTALLGTAKTGTDIGYLSGNYNAVTGIFTVTDNGSGADTLALVAGTVGTSASRAVILQGVNSASLVAANFGWNYTDLTSTYASTTWTVAGHAITGPLAIDATSSNMATNISGGGTGQTITAVGTYSVTGVTIIDLSGITGGFGTNVTLNGATGVNQALTSVVGTSGNDNFIFADGADYGTGVVTINGGSAGTDTLTITNMEGSAKVDDTSGNSGANWLLGIENISLTNGTMNLAGNSEATLTIGTHNSASQAFAVTNASNSKAATVVLNANNSTSYTGSSSTVGGGTAVDTVTINANGVAGRSISTGVGDDVVNLNVTTGVYLGSIDGGSGTDTLALSAATTADITGATVSSFEKLLYSAHGSVAISAANLAMFATSITGAAGGGDTLALVKGSGSGSFDFSTTALTGVETISTNGANVTLTASDADLTDVTTLTIGTAASTDIVLTDANDELTGITFTNTGVRSLQFGNFTVTLDEQNIETDFLAFQGNGGVSSKITTTGRTTELLIGNKLSNVSLLDVASYSSANDVVSIGGDSLTNLVTLTGNANTDLTITAGAVGTTIDARGLSTTTTTFDALVITEGLTLQVDQGFFNGVFGSINSSADTTSATNLQISSASSLDLGETSIGTISGTKDVQTTITGTLGNDTITLAASKSSGSTMVVTGNGGTDAFRFNEESGNELASAGAQNLTLANAVSISDFNSASDTFVGLGSDLSGVNLTVGSVASGAWNLDTTGPGFALITGASVADFTDLTSVGAAVGAVVATDGDQAYFAVTNVDESKVAIYQVTFKDSETDLIDATDGLTLIGVLTNTGDFTASNIGLY